MELGSPGQRARSATGDLQRPRASLDLLELFVDAVDPRIEVVSFDVPGAGGSPTRRLPYTFPMLASLLGRLLDRLGYDEFGIFGISLGGGLAQQVAFQDPRCCRRLVLVSTANGSLMVPASPLILAGTRRSDHPCGIARIMARLMPDATVHTYHDGHSAWSFRPTSWRPWSPASCSAD